MVKVLTESEYKEAVASGLAVVDFNATWCGPCKMLAPIIEELSEEYAGKVSFFSVDVDNAPDLAREYQIMSIPAIAILKDGALQKMEIGFQPKENFKKAIDAYL